jgi:translin
MSDVKSNLDRIAEQVRLGLIAKDASREKALPLGREAIRYCSTAIRSLHRHEFDTAAAMLATARDLLDDAEEAVSGCELASTAFIWDAEKEYSEGSTLLAIVTGKEVPSPEDLRVDDAAYLNGLGEAAGELRRYILDNLRRGDASRGEELLSAMDDIYNILVTIDFPDAITGGLRRTTDMVRGVLERTRSDLTLMLTQRNLETKLSKYEENIK